MSYIFEKRQTRYMLPIYLVCQNYYSFFAQISAAPITVPIYYLRLFIYDHGLFNGDCH